MTHSYCT